MKKPDVDTVSIKRFLANFMIPLVALGISALLFFFVVLPSMNGIPVLELELEEKETLANRLQEKSHKLNLLLDFKSSVEENKSLVSKVLVEEPLVPQLLTQIDIIARESGLTVDKLSYSVGDTVEIVEGGDHKIVFVNLGATGNYEQVTTFLSNLESAGRVIDVNNIRFGSNNKDDVTIKSVIFVLASPYIELNTRAVTDDPITFDITDKGFQDLMGELKDLRIYEISIDEVIDIEDLEEVPEEEQPPVEEPAEEPALSEEITPETVEPPPLDFP